MDVREKLVATLKRTDREVYEALKDREDYREEMLWDYFASNLIDHGVTVQEWISVKDRLPKPGEYVLVCDTREDFVGMWEFSGSAWYADDYMPQGIDEVTHWMPLPQPPKGE